MTPPPRDAAVVLACDAGYLPFAAALLDGIARLHPDRDFDLCVLTDGPAEPPPGLALPDLRILHPDGPNPFQAAGGRSRHGAATYLRLLVPSRVASLYRRVLYLDSDMLALGPGLGDLLRADLHGAPLAAVRDNQQWRTPDRQVEEFRRARLPTAPYLNAGLLLIDVGRFNADGLLPRALDLMARPELLPRNDQSLLNLLLHRRWTELSPVWNWQWTWTTRFFVPLAEPRLLHFIGPRKPWSDREGRLPAAYRRATREALRRLYPDRPELVAPEPDRPAWPDDLARSFLKHALAVRGMRRALDRFPTPLTTLPPC